MYRTNEYSTRHGDPWEIQLWSAELVGNVSNVGSKYRAPSISWFPFCDYVPFLLYHRIRAPIDVRLSSCVFVILLHYDQQSVSKMNVTKIRKNRLSFDNPIMYHWKMYMLDITFRKYIASSNLKSLVLRRRHRIKLNNTMDLNRMEKFRLLEMLKIFTTRFLSYSVLA